MKAYRHWEFYLQNANELMIPFKKDYGFGGGCLKSSPKISLSFFHSTRVFAVPITVCSDSKIAQSPLLYRCKHVTKMSSMQWQWGDRLPPWVLALSMFPYFFPFSQAKTPSITDQMRQTLYGKEGKEDGRNLVPWKPTREEPLPQQTTHFGTVKREGDRLLNFKYLNFK